MGLNKELMQFLLHKGFKKKEYKEQGFTFYTLEIKNKKALVKLVNHLYKLEEEEEIFVEGVSFVMEIETNGETPQWAFTGNYEKFEVLGSQQEFVEFVESIFQLLGK